MILKQVSLLAGLTLAGCASLEGKPTATSPCAFEQVWDTSIAALEGVRLLKADKDAGVLETNWVAVGSATQAGIMQRDVNKKRVKYGIEVRREGPAAAGPVLQLREERSPMGGRIRQWRAVPGSLTDEEAVAPEIAPRLQAKGS